jgi:hypothetical protein
LSDQSPKSLAGTLQVFIDIVRMRRGPEDLPFDRSLLVGTIIVFALLNLGIGQLMPNRKLPSLALVLIVTAVTLAALRFMLQLAKRSERFVQTATAIFGFQLVLVPVLLVVALLSRRAGEGSSWLVPVLMLRLALEIWVFVITTRILRSATGWPIAVCVAMIISIGMLTSLILLLLYPDAFAPAAQS